MEIVEKGTFVNDDRKDVVAIGGGGGSALERNSPWKKPAEKLTDSPVMGEKTWPSLSDVHLSKTSVEVSNAASQVSQAPAGHKKPNGGGSRNSSYKYGKSRQHKGGSKRTHNGMPPFTAPAAPSHLHYRPVPVLPHIPVHGYGYQPMPPPFPCGDNHLGKSGSQTPMKAFGPHMHEMNSSQNFQPPAQGDQLHNVPKYYAGRPNAPEGGMPTFFRLQHPLPIGQKGGMIMPPRGYMRPPTFGPPPFPVGPAFPGIRHVFYGPMPPGSIRAPFLPRFAPELVNPFASDPLSGSLALRQSIVKQIEYYFSAENLLTDHYLISQMDDQGWVPISVISGFKRVKSMCTDTLFILDALQGSEFVEVQGDKVRKRGSTSRYTIVTSSATASNNGPLSEGGSEVDISSANGGASDSSNNTDPKTEVPEMLSDSSSNTDPKTEVMEMLVDSSNNADPKTEMPEMLSRSAANMDELSNEVSSTLIT